MLRWLLVLWGLVGRLGAAGPKQPPRGLWEYPAPWDRRPRERRWISPFRF